MIRFIFNVIFNRLYKKPDLFCKYADKVFPEWRTHYGERIKERIDQCAHWFGFEMAARIKGYVKPKEETFTQMKKYIDSLYFGASSEKFREEYDKCYDQLYKLEKGLNEVIGNEMAELESELQIKETL